MPRLLFLISYLGIIWTLNAQVKVNGKVTGRHAETINRAKNAKRSAKQHKEKLKELEEQARAKQVFIERYDSIKAAVINERFKDLRTLDTAALHVRHERVLDTLNKINTDHPKFDTLSFFSKKDSIKAAQIVLSEVDFPEEYRELIVGQYETDLALTKGKSDSIALAEATVVLEEEAKKFMPSELNAKENPLTQLNNPLEGTNPFQKRTRPNPNLIKPDAAKKLFEKVNPEKLQEAQADILKLKKKYSELPDTRYPEQGTKRNSLENVPFKQRLYTGGNVSLQSTDPLILSANLQLGYWVNKKWMAGIGLVLREQFTLQDSASNTTGDGHGFSFFTRYDVPKRFFVWGEVERQVDRSLLSNERPLETNWQSSYLLGIGKEFGLGLAQMMSLVMYDFNYRNNTLNPSPWVFRLGVRFTKKP